MPTRQPLCEAISLCYERSGNQRRVIFSHAGRKHQIWFDSHRDLGLTLQDVPGLDWRDAAAIVARVRECMAEDARADREFLESTRTPASRAVLVSALLCSAIFAGAVLWAVVKAVF